MSWPVYSTRFILHTSVGARIEIVPAGYRAVLKSVTCFNSGPVAASVYLGVAGPTVWGFEVPAERGVAPAEFMIVAYQGEEVSLINQVAELRSQVSGYLFKDTSGMTGNEVTELPHWDGPPRVSPS